MKYVIALVIAAVLAPLVLAGCSGGGSAEDNWTYVGTWANTTYNGNLSGAGGPPGKIVMASSTMNLYDNDFDVAPLENGAFALTDDWTSGGNHNFKGIATLGGTGYYFLMRVSNNNNTLESVSSTTSYPASMDPASPMYGIWARQ
jgi:hypothetical protein